MARIDTGINPSASPHAEGSANPVTENSYSGYPSAPNPNVEGAAHGQGAFDSAGGTSNILAGGGGHGGFVLGNVPD